jgi:hypothetical protein
MTLPAAANGTCPACAARGRWWQGGHAPAPPPVRRQRPRGKGGATLLVCLGVVFAGLALLMLEHWYLRGRREDGAAARAEQTVVARTESARERMGQGDWDEAVRLLEEAVEVERPGPAPAGARALLLQARQAQAGALFESARKALAARETERAHRLLADYLAHPQATDRDQARLLQADLALAVSDEEAARLLGRLSDADLARFARDGDLPAGGPLRTAEARPILVATLRRHLRREEERRVGQREAARRAEVRRDERLRSTPAFRDLLAFVKDFEQKRRDEAALGERQENALRHLFSQFGATGAQEQAELRTGLHERQGTLAGLVARKGAEVKRAFRLAGEPDRADLEAFDLLVDRQLEPLLAPRRP